MAALATSATGLRAGSPPPGRSSVAGRIRTYLALTKPRIIAELLITTVPAMILAARGLPPMGLLAATLIGGSLAAGCAHTVNCYVDRDIDALMRRTSRRPLAQSNATVSPTAALRFGIVLGVVATAEMAWLVNWLSALLAVAAILVYVFVYSLGLKRRTPSNIVIGGAAGCFPVLIGWSAVTGTIGWPAVVLFAVIFLWTPPHFWALAMKFKADYAAAGVPMLPVVAPVETVVRRILAYSYAMVAASLLLIPFGAGWLYAVAAVGLGGGFLTHAHRLQGRVRRGQPARPMPLFHFSITYLTLLFAAVAVSQLL